MRILVGITGGIAAYKSAQIVRSLTELGHDVKVLPTTNALRFIGSATLEALSHNSIDPDLYSQVADVKHIKLAQEADLVIVAPATAAFLARYATGLADDLLLNVLLATTANVVIAPAMHSEMWEHPSTKKNVTTLRERGVFVIEPTVGRLTGTDTGIGRMAEPEDVVSRALAITAKNLDLLGKHIVVAAGGTREPIDQVRFIGNSSSGRQGLALAVEAQKRGADVLLIAANMEIEIPTGIKVERVASHGELESALGQEASRADAILMPVAVSDFAVIDSEPGKIKRVADQELSIRLKPNPDILANLVKNKTKQSQVIVGFAAEVAITKDVLLALAKEKLIAKGCNFIVANDVSGGAVFGSTHNSVLIVDGETSTEASGSKTAVAKAILDKLSQLIN